MNTRTATATEWKAIVGEVRAHGHGELADALERGDMTFERGGELLRPPFGSTGGAALTSPPAVSGTAGARSFGMRPTQAKSFHELTNLEKHDLLRRDPKAYRALRDAPELHDGKSFDDLEPEEHAAMYGDPATREKYLRMRERALERPSRGVQIIDPDDDDTDTAA